MEGNTSSITQDIDKTLWKNHKIHDFSPEFYQNIVETVCTPSLQI